MSDPFWIFACPVYFFPDYFPAVLIFLFHWYSFANFYIFWSFSWHSWNVLNLVLRICLLIFLNFLKFQVFLTFSSFFLLHFCKFQFCSRTLPILNWEILIFSWRITDILNFPQCLTFALILENLGIWPTFILSGQSFKIKILQGS